VGVFQRVTRGRQNSVSYAASVDRGALHHNERHSVVIRVLTKVDICNFSRVIKPPFTVHLKWYVLCITHIMYGSAILWQGRLRFSMGTSDFLPLVKFKHLHRSTWNFAPLLSPVISPKTSTRVEICLPEVAAAHMQNIRFV
jgi:hypothetical protein